MNIYVNIAKGLHVFNVLHSYKWQRFQTPLVSCETRRLEEAVIMLWKSQFPVEFCYGEDSEHISQ